MKYHHIIVILFLLAITACNKVNNNYSFQTDKQSLVLAGAAGSKDTFTIESNINWEITISPSSVTWLKADIISGSDNKQVIVETTDENPGLPDRKASIVVTPTGNSHQSSITINVTNRFYHWSKIFTGNGGATGNAITTSADGGFVAAGFSYSDNFDFTGNHGSTDVVVVKRDLNGNKVWTKCLGGTGPDFANNIINTQDNGYLVVGSTNSIDGDVTGNSGTDENVWVIKLDADGNILWNKTYGGAGIDVGLAVASTTDGYIIASASRSNDGDVSGHHNTGSEDIWMMKINTSGNIIWQKSLGGTGQDFSLSIISTTGDGILIAGNTNSNNDDVTGNHGGQDAWLVKLNAAGDLVWQKTFGGSADEFVGSIESSGDGGFVVAGRTYSIDGDLAGLNGGNDTNGWILKIDGSGNKLWSNKIGWGTAGTSFSSILRSPDMGYVLCGSINRDSLSPWVVKITADGNMLSENFIGSHHGDFANDLVRSSNGYYVAVGEATTGGDVEPIFVGFDARGLWMFRFKVD